MFSDTIYTGKQEQPMPPTHDGEVITRVSSQPVTIDIQPTWAQMMSVMLMALEPQAPRATVDFVRSELMRVAKFLDDRNFNK